MTKRFMFLFSIPLLIILSSVNCSKPAEFQIVSLDVMPSKVYAGKSVDIVAQVNNIGGIAGVYKATLVIDGNPTDTKDINLDKNSKCTVNFTITKDKPGKYEIMIGTQSRVLTVEEPAPVITYQPKFTDEQKDVFDSNGKIVNSEPYMDIIETELTSVQSYYIAKIKVNGTLPSNIDPPALVEYNVMIDIDRNPNTGWNNFLLFGDIGADYYVTVYLSYSKWIGRITDTKNNTTRPIEYTAENNIIEFRIPESYLTNKSFNVTFAARRYARNGDGSSLVMADKSPNKGHFSYAEGKLSLE